eukprot:2845634-Pleurochrysis_carterae.AAC.1
MQSREWHCCPAGRHVPRARSAQPRAVATLQPRAASSLTGARACAVRLARPGRDAACCACARRLRVAR